MLKSWNKKTFSEETVEGVINVNALLNALSINGSRVFSIFFREDFLLFSPSFLNTLNISFLKHFKKISRNHHMV